MSISNASTQETLYQTLAAYGAVVERLDDPDLTQALREKALQEKAVFEASLSKIDHLERDARCQQGELKSIGLC